MIVPEANAFIIPPNVDYSTAAALKSVYGTALHGLRDRARLNRGETLLVLGAAGGVGLAFVEIGALLGANVIGAVSTEEKADLLKRFNVRHIVNYSTGSLRDNVRELTNGKGADVIIDPVGGDLFEDALRTIAWGGRLCVVGFSSGRIPQLPLNQALLKSFDLVGVNYGGWVDRDPQAHRRETEELVEWCGSGTIRPHISTTLPLAEVAAAMRLLQDRTATGKILLSI
jgi:NADPH:quinone reductase